MRKTRVILNPAAGSVTDVPKLIELLHGLGKLQVEVSAKRGAVERLARKALRDGCKLIIAAGGDGTLNEVVNGIGKKSSGVQIGLLPLGTGNDFARSLGLPVKLEAAHAAGRRACGAFVKLHDRLEFRIFDDRVLQVGHFAVVFEE